jgi:hypothetical protein
VSKREFTGTIMDNGRSLGARPGSKGGELLARSSQTDREKVTAVRARQRAIGRELRRMYDDVVQEPVPDDFLDLLHKIDEAAEKKGKQTT